MNEGQSKIPDQKELEKELNDYLSKKYGDRVKLGVSMLVPKTAFDDPETGDQDKPKGISRIKFDMKPEELEGYLDEMVVKQENAKEILATKICTHFNRIQFMENNRSKERFDEVGHIKNNIIMIGPTGVGKTYIIRLIAKKLGVPFVKGDATKFSETGYVGGDVEDLVRDLVHEAEGDVELAQYGIIYVDEIDKIASNGNLVGPDVSRTGVQRALLKPMEETEVELKVPHDPISLMEAIEQFRKTGKRERKKVNTKNILFIVSGAFNDLQDIVKRRMSAQGIGFAADIRTKEERSAYLRHVKAEDLLGYGFESEFVGRLPVVAIFDPLEVEDLYEILRNPSGPIVQSKKQDFRAYGIDIRFEDEALRLFAEWATEEQTGARGLVSVVERVLMRFEKKLPSTHIKTLAVDVDLVKDPEGMLERILNNPDDPELTERYERCLAEERQRTKTQVNRKVDEYRRRFGEFLTERRVEMIVDQVVTNGSDLVRAFEDMARIYKAIRFHERRFFERSDLHVTFDDGAVDRILERCLEEGVRVGKWMEELLSNYEHGLRLVQEKIGQDEFILTREAVEDPEEYLNNLIRDFYSDF